MAVSLLDQRYAPLELRAPVLFPCGPGLLPPSMEVLAEEYGDDGVALAGRRLRRSHTWAGYAGRLEAPAAEAADAALAQELLEGCGPEKVEEGDESGESGSTAPGSAGSSRRGSRCSSPWEEAEEVAALPATRISLECCLGRLGLGGAAGRPGAAAGQPRRGRRARGQRCVTTYMVQNMARSVTRHRFLEVLNCLGFAGRYDYVHVPTSFQTGRNQGFAFVNFVSEEAAREFAGHFHVADGLKPADKVWRVAPADVQGFEANSKAAQKGKLARVRSSAHRPLVFSQGPGSAPWAP